MKEKRNCNQAYPMYGMPQMIPPMPIYPNTYQNTFDINSLSDKINSLEERVSRLEKIVLNNNNNYNKYNDSNYYMV